MPTTNPIHNPTFAQQGAGWNTEGTVDYSRHYCRINTGEASQSISVTPLASYRLRFYTQAIFNGSGELVLEPEPPEVSRHWAYPAFHPWTERDVTYEVPAGTSTLKLRLIGSAGEMCFDEFNLEEVVLPPNPELIINPEFDDDLNDWKPERPNMNSTVSTANGVCQATMGGYLYQDINVAEGKTYTFKLLASTPFGGTGVAQLFDTNDVSAELLKIDLQGANSFMNFESDFPVPSGTTTLRVQMVGITTLQLESVSFKLK